MAEHAHAHANDHGHTNYVKIWGILVVLLIVSIIGPEFGIRVVTLITAFGIAIVKAYIVGKYFMHLGIEKKWVTWILLAMLAFMLVFFGGVAPDVLKHDGQNWIKLYEEPAVGAGTAAH
jgi:caa(3)-type oxidase subunit IV